MKKTNGAYYVNRHSCFLLQYHLVLVTKYRRPVLDGDAGSYAYDVIKETLKNRGANLIDMNGEPDHVHILFEMGPEKSVMETVNVIKTRTARLVRSRYPEWVKKFYWSEKPLFWTDSYFVATVGYNTEKIVADYIKNQ